MNAPFWQENLLETQDAIDGLLMTTRVVAVVGIKPESHARQPAHYVPAFLQARGLRVIPVPTYFPEVTHILGNPVSRDLAAISEPVDIAEIFRRPEDVPGHLEALLRLRPRAVWLQKGIRHTEVAEHLAQAGILVVQDRCMMEELLRRDGHLPAE